MINIFTASALTRSNDFPTLPAYVIPSPEFVYLNMNSTEMSDINATAKMTMNPGIMPNALKVAGTDMIPAPIMVVVMLNTAPEVDPFSEF